MQSTRPTFIGIGGQKCATTWLAECLRAHPQIFLSSPKEIDYFGSRTRGGRSIDWYLGHFSSAAGYEAVGEFSTRYLTKQSSLEALRKAFPEIQIVVSLREPVDRFISAWKHAIRGEILPKSEFGQINKNTLAKAAKIAPSLLADGLYSSGIEYAKKNFGKENVHIIIKDRIDQQPMLVLNNLYRFLGVETSFVPPVAQKTVSLGIMPRYVFLERLRRLAHRMAKYRFPWLIDFGHQSGASALFRRFNASRNVDLHIDVEALEGLKAYYREEVGKLRAILGLELEGW